jgi:hypothetical protein
MLHLKNSILRNAIGNCKLTAFFIILSLFCNIIKLNNIITSYVYKVNINYKIQLKVYYCFHVQINVIKV